jgi:hypothetical protein
MAKEKQLTRKEKIEQARQLLNEIYSFELNEEALETLIGGVRQKSYAELAESAARDEKASII